MSPIKGQEEDSRLKGGDVLVLTIVKGTEDGMQTPTNYECP